MEQMRVMLCISTLKSDTHTLHSVSASWYSKTQQRWNLQES